MNSLVPPSPPDTITTSTLATSIIASALSTAECTISNFPAARPERCAFELSVNSNSSLMPCLAKMPFSTPTKNGSDRAVGKVLSRTSVSSAALAGPAIRASAKASAAKRMDLMTERSWAKAHCKVVKGSRLVCSPSFRGAPLGANPESILPVVVMDSGFASFARAPE